MIIPVQNFNFNFKSNRVSTINNRNVLPYQFLKPLQYDVVSFSGRAKLLSENMKDAPSEYTCRTVEENSEPARFYLDSVLNKYLGQYISKAHESKLSSSPIARCSTRKKTPASIREKVVSKYSKLQRQEVNKFSNQVFDELSQYFRVNPNVNKNTIIADIRRVIDSDDNRKKLPIYQNSAYYLMEIIELLKKYNRFDFDSVSADRFKKIYSEIVESLEDSAPSESIDVDPNSIAGIKHYAKDIVGARILLRDADPEYTSIIINALKKAVEDGKLKITSIENNVPDPDKLPPDKQISDYLYATDAQLRSLAKASGAELIKNKSKTGYLAVHINVDLSNKAFERNNGVFNGYSGEIQIIGEDVEKLKDIEDLCYKLKDNKNAIHIAYKPFREHFLKYYNESTKDAFDDYTYALYLAQRALKTGTKRNTVFPTLAELGFDTKLPPELDFNLLRKIKSDCDKKLKAMEEEQLSQNRNNIATTAKSIRKRDEIKLAKSYVSYMLN